VKRKTIRAGIVGAGYAARFHFDSLQRVVAADVQVEGVYDLRADAATAYAQPRGIRPCPSLQDLLDRVDVVHVCTPPVSHEEIVVAALARDKFAIVEKPLTGYFGDGSAGFNGDRFPKQEGLAAALASVERMLAAEAASRARLLYAENWVYAPAVQKEREIIEKTGAQVLWIHGEQAHSGSTAPTYGSWKFNGGGSLIGKGCHPLTAALYLKRVEGRTRLGRPIRPRAVSARTHALTRLEGFQNKGHLRADYHDIEDFSMIHVVFEDGTVATVFASEIILGGVHNWLEVCANNHRAVCNLNPNTAMAAYNPVEEYFKDIYTIEKIGTKQGWSNLSPDENHFAGYPQEMEAFYRTVTLGEEPESTGRLAADAISAIYSAYVSAERQGAEVPVKTF
jgi:predicted dehydrogenase